MIEHPPPQLLDRRYRAEQLIGHGAVATVWRGVDARTGERVALKVMRPDSLGLEDIQRLAQEVEILRRLSHPCIVRILGTGVAEGNAPYVAMEWVDGIDLRAKLEQSPVLPLADVRDIISQVCCGLTEAHAQGIIHRDIKPENVLLAAPEHVAVKLADFGMAKVTGRQAAALTVEGQLFGTPQYMAPERARGKPAGEAADLYAVAVMTYEMLAGRRPFDGRSPMQILIDQTREAPPRFPCPLAVEEVLLAGLAKEPSARPTSEEFARRLSEAVG